MIAHNDPQDSQGNPGYSITYPAYTRDEINEWYLSSMESIAKSSLKNMLENEHKVILVVVLALDDLIVFEMNSSKISEI